jgi:hypothetical protein
MVGGKDVVDSGKEGRMSASTEPEEELSSAKREDIWALIIAGMVMLLSMAAPETVHNVFKNLLYVF